MLDKQQIEQIHGPVDMEFRRGRETVYKMHDGCFIWVRMSVIANGGSPHTAEAIKTPETEQEFVNSGFTRFDPLFD